MKEEKLRRRRGRGKKKTKGSFVTLADYDVSKRENFLSLKKWAKTILGFENGSFNELSL